MLRTPSCWRQISARHFPWQPRWFTATPSPRLPVASADFPQQLARLRATALAAVRSSATSPSASPPTALATLVESWRTTLPAFGPADAVASCLVLDTCLAAGQAQLAGTVWQDARARHAPSVHAAASVAGVLVRHAVATNNAVTLRLALHVAYTHASGLSESAAATTAVSVQLVSLLYQYLHQRQHDAGWRLFDAIYATCHGLPIDASTATAPDASAVRALLQIVLANGSSSPVPVPAAPHPSPLSLALFLRAWLRLLQSMAGRPSADVLPLDPLGLPACWRHHTFSSSYPLLPLEWRVGMVSAACLALAQRSQLVAAVTWLNEFPVAGKAWPRPSLYALLLSRLVRAHTQPAGAPQPALMEAVRVVLSKLAQHARVQPALRQASVIDESTSPDRVAVAAVHSLAEFRSQEPLTLDKAILSALAVPHGVEVAVELLTTVLDPDLVLMPQPWADALWVARAGVRPPKSSLVDPHSVTLVSRTALSQGTPSSLAAARRLLDQLLACQNAYVAPPDANAEGTFRKPRTWWICCFDGLYIHSCVGDDSWLVTQRRRRRSWAPRWSISGSSTTRYIPPPAMQLPCRHCSPCSRWPGCRWTPARFTF